MKLGTFVRRVCGVVAAGTLLAVIAAPVLRAQVQDSKEVSALLLEAKSHAILAADDAATLQSYTNSSISWQTHAAKLNLMREHVNSLGQINKQLTDLRSQGSPWQQIAIDRIDPLLRDMANQLSATINRLNDHPNQVHMPAYRDYVQANHEFASRTAEIIRDFVDYDRAKATVERLEAKLELPPHEGD